MSSHSYDIWSDTVRGVGCIDHYTRQAEIPTTFSPPYYKVVVGGDNKWLTTLTTTSQTGDQRQVKVEAETRAEMVYNILCDVSGSMPNYDRFIKWYCYPSTSITMTTLASNLELQRQLLPLQNHVDRQLFNERVQCVLEVFCSINIIIRVAIIYTCSSHDHLVSNTVCNPYISFQRSPTRNSWKGTILPKILILGNCCGSKQIVFWISENFKTKHCNHLRQTFNHCRDICVNPSVSCPKLNILITFQGVFAPRSDLEGLRPFSCVARQAVRRLVSLGFNLDNLKASFKADPQYEIPANVFLQDMTQVWH